MIMIATTMWMVTMVAILKLKKNDFTKFHKNNDDAINYDNEMILDDKSINTMINGNSMLGDSSSSN